MNQNNYNKLKAITERIDIYCNLGVLANYQMIKSNWELSRYYNKCQSDNIKSNCNDGVKSCFLFNEITKEVEPFTFYSFKIYSRLEWFLILTLMDNYATKQSIDKALIEFKF